MCGIAGIFDLTHSMGKEKLIEVVRQMGDQLTHRGPDDSGIWINEANGVALVHRRLSIIDLSAAGHQPMISHCGRYIIVFNGEIYNFSELRQQLQAQVSDIPLRGHSDTEIFLAGMSQWGIENTLQKSVGMFAFALWDNKTKTLTLARDRMGEKPLYYGYVGKFLVFASELKALRTCPKFNAEIDREVISLYLRHNYIPAPYSIYKGIYKLYPGCLLTIQANKEISPFPTTDNTDLSKYTPHPYWALDKITQQALEKPFTGADEEAADILEQLLIESVRGQMIADVPVGAFLSGGIDSSTVVALMQANSSQPVRTFSIGFYEENYNEAKQAKAIAKHLETEHTELYVTSNEAIAVIPQLPTWYDEPFADSSQIPTYLLSQLTKNHVTVSLSGDGGDELFCGYPRYFSGHRLWNMIKRVPVFMRKATSRTLSLLPESTLDMAFFWLSPHLKKYNYDNKIGYHLHRVAEVIGVENAMAFYQQAMSHWKNPWAILKNDKDYLLPEPLYIYNQNYNRKLKKDLLRQMMLIDALSYLPDDILVKVDRASMAVSLESRIPLLDHRIVEFAMSLPVAMNYQNGVGKKILRRVLYRYVPKNLVERPKMGFGIPLDNWLRGPLKEWAESLLEKSRLQQEGYFYPQPILKKWQEHLSGQRHWQYELWDILMFQAWLEGNN